MKHTLLIALILATGCGSVNYDKLQAKAEKKLGQEIDEIFNPAPTRDTGPQDAIDMDKVKWCYGMAPKNLPIQYAIENARYGGIGLEWDGNVPPHYKGISKGCNAALGFVVKIDESYYGAWGEQVRVKLNNQTLALFHSRDGLTFKEPLEEYSHKRGAEYWIGTACGVCAFEGRANHGRSNFIRLK